MLAESLAIFWSSSSTSYSSSPRFELNCCILSGFLPKGRERKYQIQIKSNQNKIKHQAIIIAN